MIRDTNVLLTELTGVVRSAGAAILKHYDGGVAVQYKADESPLTAADMDAHRIIVDALRQIAPEIPVLSEEAADIPWEERRTWSEHWLVDPLDGTKEFLNKNGEFTVNIALVRGHIAVLGVVHAPALGTTYLGARGHGARRISAENPAEPIKVTATAPATVRVVGSRSHRGSSLDAYLERLGTHEMVPMGSSLKFCVVAEGRADVYPRFGPTSEWDTAAAQAVLEAAGGWTVDLHGAPLRYNAKADLLNPHFIAYGDDSRQWWQMA